MPAESTDEQLDLSVDIIDLELAHRHLSDFVQQMWPVVEPGKELVWGWPLDAICEHLEAVTNGDIKNLIINVPPRFLKSTIVSVMWPAWEWLHDPRIRYLTASYDKQLAVRDAVRTRRLINHPNYIAMNLSEDGKLRFVFAGDQNVKSSYENNQTGTRICTSPSSGATGHGGDRIMVDDPHNVKESESEDQRNEVKTWWDKTMSTRRNDPKTAARVIIMQRLHEDDLTGHCLETKIYDHLCLPLLYENEHPHKSSTRLNFEDPRSSEGHLLMPDRIGPEEAEEFKTELGTYGFVGQMQQRPAPAGGVIFQHAWFNQYDIPPSNDQFHRMWTTWDATFKGKENKRGMAAEIAAIKELSFVVGQCWGSIGSNSYLLDEERGQWNILRTIEAMLRMRENWTRATAHLVEAKANGPAIETLLRDQVPGLLLVEPKGSKVQRAIAVQPFCEAGNVWLPSKRLMPTIDDWKEEICSFPFGRYNDRVDSFTQGLIWAHVDTVQRSLRALQQMTGGQR